MTIHKEDLVQPVADAGYPLIAMLIRCCLGDGSLSSETAAELRREVQLLAVEHEMARRFIERGKQGVGA